MNLSMDVLRWLTVKAIRGRTWALDRVYDSPATPADIRTLSEREPYIAVYVDDADSMEGEAVALHDPAVAQLVIEVAVSSPFTVSPEGDVVEPGQPAPEGSTIANMLNATDEALEAQIGLISRQAMDALTSTLDNNPYAELWRELTASQIQKMQIRRGGPPGDENRAKPRFASRVTIIHTGVLGEPVRGAHLGDYPFWQRLFDLLEGDEEMGGLIGLVRAHIERPGGELPDWRLAQKQFGIPQAAARALGIAPISGFDGPPGPAFEHPQDEITDIGLAPSDDPGHPEVVGSNRLRREEEPDE